MKNICHEYKDGTKQYCSFVVTLFFLLNFCIQNVLHFSYVTKWWQFTHVVSRAPIRFGSSQTDKCRKVWFYGVGPDKM